jgi:hypothetical protein
MPTIASLQPRNELHQRLRLPLLLTLAAGLVSAGIASFLPNYYKSEIRILSDTGSSGAGSANRAGVWAPSATPETPGSREDGPTVIFADILKSRRMAETLLQASYDYHIQPKRFGPAIAVQGTLREYLKVGSTDKGIGPLKTILVVQRDMKSGMLTLSAETRSPELSLQVAQGAVRNLKAFLVELSQSTGNNKARFTEERLEAVRATYDKLGREFLGFQEANRNWETSPAPSVRFRGSRLKEDLDLWRTVLNNLTLNHEQALLEARNDTQALLVMDPGNLPVDKSRPSRSFIVFLSMAVTAAVSWTVVNRSIVKNRLLAKEPAA